MGPIIPLILVALEQAIKHVPALAVEVTALLAKQNPTPEDWRALQAKYTGKTYEGYVPSSGLIPTPAPAKTDAGG